MMKSLLTKMPRNRDLNNVVSRMIQGRARMLGLRRTKFGIAALALAFSGQAAYAQWESSAGNHPSGYVTSMPMEGAHPFAGQGAVPWAPGMESAQIQQAQFSPPPPPVAGPPIGGGGAPGGPLQPYPGIDMFRYGFQQTINHNGLWYKEMLNASRTYKGRVEFIVPVYSEPGDELFGYGGIETGIYATDRVPDYFFTTPRTPSSITVGGGGGGNNNTNINGIDFFSERYFPYFQFSDMFRDMSGSGISIDLGFENEDGSGWTVNGWYGGESNQAYSRGGVPRRSYTPTIDGDPFNAIPGNDPLYLLELSALTGSLPVNNGNGVADRIVFDTLFEMEFSTQAWGAGLQIYRPAIAKGDWYQYRPIVGLRYVDLRERYGFRGLDSGGEYDFLSFNDVDFAQEFATIAEVDALINSTGGAQNSGEPGFEGRPEPDTFNDDIGAIDNGSTVVPLNRFATNPYETQVAASTHTHAAGPEIGIEAEFGGDTTQLIFTAVGGITATKENINLDGFGVYNHFINSVDPDNDDTTPDGGQMGTGVGGIPDEDTIFSDRASSTHVSPILDLSVRFESQLFQYVPVINKFEFFNEAHFSTSYGFLYVGNVSRPQSSIDYSTFPINPQINPNRSGWTMTQWTFGLRWEH